MGMLVLSLRTRLTSMESGRPSLKPKPKLMGLLSTTSSTSTGSQSHILPLLLLLPHTQSQSHVTAGGAMNQSHVIAGGANMKMEVKMMVNHHQMMMHHHHLLLSLSHLVMEMVVLSLSLLVMEMVVLSLSHLVMEMVVLSLSHLVTEMVVLLLQLMTEILSKYRPPCCLLSHTCAKKKK